MKVKEIEENEDGSATVTFDITPEEVRMLLDSAIVIGLIEGLKLAKEKKIKEFENNEDC